MCLSHLVYCADPDTANTISYTDWSAKIFYDPSAAGFQRFLRIAESVDEIYEELFPKENKESALIAQSYFIRALIENPELIENDDKAALTRAYRVSRSRPLGQGSGFSSYMETFKTYYQSHYKDTPNFPPGFCLSLSILHGYFSGIYAQDGINRLPVETDDTVPRVGLEGRASDTLSTEDIVQNFEEHGLLHIKNKLTGPWLARQMQTIDRLSQNQASNPSTHLSVETRPDHDFESYVALLLFVGQRLEYRSAYLDRLPRQISEDRFSHKALFEMIFTHKNLDLFLQSMPHMDSPVCFLMSSFGRIPEFLNVKADDLSADLRPFAGTQIVSGHATAFWSNQDGYIYFDPNINRYLQCSSLGQLKSAIFYTQTSLDYYNGIMAIRVLGKKEMDTAYLTPLRNMIPTFFDDLVSTYLMMGEDAPKEAFAESFLTRLIRDETPHLSRRFDLLLAALKLQSFDFPLKAFASLSSLSKKFLLCLKHYTLDSNLCLNYQKNSRLDDWKSLQSIVEHFLVSGNDPLMDQFIAHHHRRMFLALDVVEGMDAYVNGTLSKEKQRALQALLMHNLDDVNSLVSSCLHSEDPDVERDFFARILNEDPTVSLFIQRCVRHIAKVIAEFPTLASVSLSILSKKVFFITGASALEGSDGVDMAYARPILELFTPFEHRCAQYLKKYDTDVTTRENRKAITLLDSYFNGAITPVQRSALEAIVEQKLRSPKSVKRSNNPA